MDVSKGGGSAAEEWRVWGFTSVIFQRGDRVAFGMGLLSLTPQILIAAFIAANLSCFHPQFVAIHVGLACNEAINFGLKHWFQEARPLHPCPFAHRADFGFPSSHAQFMFFFATQTAMLLLSKRSGGPPSLRRRRQCVAAFVFALAAAVCVSRVWNAYHTVQQVVVGALLGTALGVAFARVQVLVRMVRCVVQWIRGLSVLVAWYDVVGAPASLGPSVSSPLASKSH